MSLDLAPKIVGWSFNLIRIPLTRWYLDLVYDSGKLSLQLWRRSS